MQMLFHKNNFPQLANIVSAFLQAILLFEEFENEKTKLYQKLYLSEDSLIYSPQPTEPGNTGLWLADNQSRDIRSDWLYVTRIGRFSILLIKLYI